MAKSYPKLLGALLLSSAVLLSACGGTAGKDAVATGGSFQFHSPGGQQEIFYEPSERSPVHELEGPSVLDLDKTIKLSDYEGKIVVLNAWGQWCAPCRSESDDLQEVHEYALEHNGTVLGINVRDFNPEISRDFMRDNGLSYPSIYDPPFKTAVALGGVPAAVVPTTIVLDKQHRPAAVFLREITADDLKPVIDRINAE